MSARAIPNPIKDHAFQELLERVRNLVPLDWHVHVGLFRGCLERDERGTTSGQTHRASPREAPNLPSRISLNVDA